MKGGFYIPRGVRLPFVLFALFGMAIFIWGGEKNPLAALFPPYGPYLRLSPGLVGPSVKFIPPEIHNDADNHRITLPRNETSKEKAAQSIQIGPKPNYTGEVKSASSRKKVVHVDNNQPSYGQMMSQLKVMEKSLGYTGPRVCYVQISETFLRSHTTIVLQKMNPWSRRHCP